MNETELPADGPRPSAPTGPNTTPAVAAARRQLEACRRSETLLVEALADVEAVVLTRSLMGVGIVGARNAPAAGQMGPVDALVAQGFQTCGTNAVADLYILLASVRQAGHAALVRLKRAEAMAEFDHLDPADDPLSPADSEGGAL